MSATPDDGLIVAAPHQSEAVGDQVPLLLAVIVIAIFIPEAFGYFVGDFRLTIERTILILAAPFYIVAFGGLIASNRYRFVLSDLLVPVAMLWMLLAQAQTDGLDKAIKAAGGAAIDFAGPYLAMRSLIKTNTQAQRIAGLFCVTAGVAGFLGILDVVTNQHILREGLASLTGYRFYAPRDAGDYRLGFLRAQGPLEHPILYGIVMGYALLLSRALSGGKQMFCRVGCAVGVFLSASSAAWTSVALGVVLAIYGRHVKLARKWMLLMVPAALASALFILAMSRPFGWLLNHLTLDASSGYVRLMIWDAAGADVLDSPIFGIGATDDWFRPSWMPNSVDSLWLRLAMVYGIPGSLLMALALISAASLRCRLTEENRGRLTDKDIVLSETLGIIIFLVIYTSFTVDYWGSAWFMLGIIAGLRAFLGQWATE